MIDLEFAAYPDVPEHLRAGLVGYVTHGRLPGGFLCAVLCNDLTGALNAADEKSMAGLGAVVQWLWMEAPGICWGSVDALKTWAKNGGLQGKAGWPTKSA